MKPGLLVLALIAGCAHLPTVDRPEEGSGGGFGFLAQRYAREMALGMNAPEAGCSLGVDCFARSLALSANLTVAGTTTFTGASTFSSTVTALTFVSTQVANSNAYLINTAGARLKLSSAGTTDYLTSNGTTMISAAGDFGVAGEVTAADYRAPGTAAFDVNLHAASGTAGTWDCSVDLGASDYCLSVRDNGTTVLARISGTGVVTATAVTATGAVTGGSLVSNDTLDVTGNATFSDDIDAKSTLANSTASQPVRVTDAQGFAITAQTLPTCSASLEWGLVPDAASGVSTGARSRMCMCTSDGAGSPAYAWQNVVTANIGNTTTCPP